MIKDFYFSTAACSVTLEGNALFLVNFCVIKQKVSSSSLWRLTSFYSSAKNKFRV